MADVAMESDGKAAVGRVVQRRLGIYNVNFCDVGYSDSSYQKMWYFLFYKRYAYH